MAVACANKHLSQSQLRRGGPLYPVSELSESLVSAGWSCFDFAKWTMDRLYLVENSNIGEKKVSKVTPEAYKLKINTEYLKKKNRVESISQTNRGMERESDSSL